MDFNQDDWVNATDLRLAALGEQLLQASDVLGHLCRELKEVGETIQAAKLYQLGLTPKPTPQPEPKRADEPPAKPKPRQSFRTVVTRLAKEHGEELSSFVLGNIIGTSRTVESVQKAMKTFMGTFPSPETAAVAFAKENGMAGHDPFEVMAMARFRLVHDDGRVSIWSNYVAPGDLDQEEDETVEVA